MPNIFATTNPEISEREKRNMERARSLAADGMVLLKNDGVLPMKGEGKIALFGNGARGTVKGGTGSGDVNSRMVINVEQGLSDAGFIITTGEWMDRYDRAIEEARIAHFKDVKQKAEEGKRNVFWYLFNNPFQNPAIVPITEDDIEKSDAETAIYVIGRSSGEGKDRKPVPGQYELLDEEKRAIKLLVDSYQKVIVVLNVGGVIDTKYLRETEGINAIVLMSQAGNIGGYALADIITGKVTPSGRLTSTWAEKYEDYPNAMEYSHMNGNVDDEYYSEGIYVGYRYFDSFGIKPAYPFGYGLSYTTFDVDTIDVSVDKDRIKLSVKVINTGDKYSGREVVQVYYSAPEGMLEKPYQELVAFAKTGLLAPGEEETLTLCFAAGDMASYDKARQAWVLESGKYYVRVGTHSRNTKIVAGVELSEDVVTQKLKNLFTDGCHMELFSSKGATPFTYINEEEEKREAKVVEFLPGDILCSEIVYRKEDDVDIVCDAQEHEKYSDTDILTIDDVKSGRATLDQLIAQLTVEELAEMCVGTARQGIAASSIVGVASLTPGAAGDTARHLREGRNVQSVVMADGPAGLRLSRVFVVDSEGKLIPGAGEAPMPGMEILFGDRQEAEIGEGAVTYYQYCTALPVATLLAQTWDVEAYEAAGDIVGEEMSEFGIHLWLAPGMNIHRNPLCGRNFEYYSEDPVITGVCATKSTIGVQKHTGRGTTIKHYAFNNQEDNRMRTNAYIDERAIREIYLKGFEMAVKEANPMAIMTSYNLINQVHTANSKELCTYIARDEWGFEGAIVSDWNTTGSMDPNRNSTNFKYPYANPAACIKAGNDIIMPGSQWDVDSIVKAVGAKEGEVECPITLAELRACAKRVLEMVMKSWN